MENRAHLTALDGTAENGWETTGVVDLLQPQEIRIQPGKDHLEIADIGASRIAEIGVLWALVERKVADVPRNDPQHIVSGSRWKIRQGDFRSGKAAAAQPTAQHEGQRADQQDRDDNRYDEGL